MLLLALLIQAAQFSSQEPAPISADSVCGSVAGFVGPCSTLRGRITLANGAFLIKIWPVGTKRFLAVDLHRCQLPADVERLVDEQKDIYRLGEAPLMTELQDAVAKAATAEEERNVLIHSIWFAGHTNDEVHRVKITAKRKVGRRVQSEQVSPADIAKVAERLAEATFVVMQVHAKHR